MHAGRPLTDLQFRPVERARACKTLKAMRRVLYETELRVKDAVDAKWPALAQSWQMDCDRVKQLIAERTEVSTC